MTTVTPHLRDAAKPRLEAPALAAILAYLKTERGYFERRMVGAMRDGGRYVRFGHAGHRLRDESRHASAIPFPRA